MKYQASDGDTAQTDSVVDNNDVSELIQEENDELEICNVQNNKDITREDALAKYFTRVKVQRMQALFKSTTLKKKK